MQMQQSITSFDEFFPLAAAKDGFLVSKTGDVTAGFEVSLPAAFGVDAAGYDAMSSSLLLAASVFADASAWTMIHRQDVFRLETVGPDEGLKGFLGTRLSEHFEGRQCLVHRQFLFVTLTSKNSALREGASSGVFGFRGKRVTPDPQELYNFDSKVKEFASSLVQGGNISLRRLDEEELVGNDHGEGLVMEYLFGRPVRRSPIERAKDYVYTGGKYYMGVEVCDADRMPAKVRNCNPFGGRGSEGSGLVLSDAASLGLRLGCEHMVNHYILIPRQETVLSELDTRKGRMRAMGDNASNEVNSSGLEQFLKDVRANATIVCYSNINVVFWKDTLEAVRALAGDVTSAFTPMGMRGSLVSRDFPVLWYAGIPGAECEMGKDHLMLGTLEAAVLQSCQETFDEGIPGGLLRFVDRLRHRPVPFDTQKASRDAHLISNYNMFVSGPSGSGKSFTMNRYCYSGYESGESFFLLDIGKSYEGTFRVINEESGGRDGQLYSWDDSTPLHFNPLSSWRDWCKPGSGTDDETGGLEFFVSLLKTIWSPEGGVSQNTSDIIEEMVLEFIRSWKKSSNPLFDDFYEFADSKIAPKIRYGDTLKNRDEGEMSAASQRKCWRIGSVVITTDKIDIDGLLLSLKSYSKKRGGKFSYFFDGERDSDLFTSRFVGVDLQKVASGDARFYSVVVLCIMNAFDRRMRSWPGFKNLVIDEAWKAIDNPSMASYLRELWKTARKYSTACVVITQQIEDVVGSAIIKNSIIDNSDVKFILEQGGNENLLEQAREVYGLSPREMGLVRSINRMKDARYPCNEVFVWLGGKRSGVYGIEACPAELEAFESEFEAKKPVMWLAQRTGSYCEAVRILCGESQMGEDAAREFRSLFPWKKIRNEK